jgi:signal peptidase I
MRKIFLLLSLGLLLAAGCNTISQTTPPNTTQNATTNPAANATSTLQAMVIAANSMSPALKKGGYAIIDESITAFSRGDVVAYKYPKDQTQYFIHRIVGLPGEQVEIKDGAFYINGNRLDESQYLSSDVKTYGLPGVVTLKAGEYFVAGDNRTASSDSRVWGALNQNLIIGKFIKKTSNP